MARRLVLVAGGAAAPRRWPQRLYPQTLTGLGERSHLLAPDVGLSCHVQDVVNVLTYEDLQDVTLVGHSYGGMVITGVADRCAARITQLVYLAAMVPRHGESTLDQLAATSTVREAAEAIPAAEPTEMDWRIPPDPPEAFGITVPEDVRWVAERLSPQPFATLTEPLDLSRGVGARIPRTFISCTVGQEQEMPSIARAAARVRSEPGWRYHELETGHDSMITMPEATARLLLDAAG
jgi:pimeloyl-ACP methyl ester carboxylesterase